MKTKLIGVSARITSEGETIKQFVNERYIKRLTERGLNTLMLTTDNPDIEQILKLCDGFLITGGSDVDPRFYNENNDDGVSKGCNEALDQLDMAITQYAAKNKKPLIGICRGHQSINVFLGGSLIQHIDNHSGIKNGQEMTTIPNHLFNFDEAITANSYHHQAIKTLAPGLIEIVYSNVDKINEAFIHESLPIIGIQWHPEIISDSKESKIIFDKFAELVNKK